MFETRTPTSFKHVSFWSPFFISTPNRTSLKYRCPFRTSNQIKHAYLMLPWKKAIEWGLNAGGSNVQVPSIPF